MFTLIHIVIVYLIVSVVKSDLTITSPLLQSVDLPHPNITLLWSNLLSTEEVKAIREFLDALYLQAFQNRSLNTCERDIAILLSSITKAESWTHQWLDAQGKVPSGLMKGALRWPGSFGTCRRSIGFRKNRDIFRGQYLQSSLSVDMTLSHCYNPESEDSRDIWYFIAIALITIILIIAGFGTLVETFLWIRYCTNGKYKSNENVPSGEQSEQDGADSSIHLKQYPVSEKRTMCKYPEYRDDQLKQHPCLAHALSFSVPFNALSLLAPKHTLLEKLPQKGDSGKGHPPHTTPRSKRRLAFLDGFRAISISWIIIGHTFGYAQPYCNNAIEVVREMLAKWSFQTILSGTLAVDNFFFMSGILVVYVSMRRYQELSNKISRIKFWFVYVLHRFIRITPTYVVLLLLYTGLFNHIYQGPLYPNKPELNDIHNCKSHGYLTYLNNLIRVDERCMGWSWYLACEMQFSLILAPIFIVTMSWNPIIGLLFLFALTISAPVIMSVKAYQHNFPFLPVMDMNFWRVYVAPYTRWGTYAMGMFMGWLLTRCPKQASQYPAKKRALIRLVMLALASFLCLITIYGRAGVASGRVPDPGPVVRATFHGLFRVGFIIGIGIFTFLCANGWIDFVRNWLASDTMNLLAQLTFSTYLLHPIVIQFIFAGSQTPLIMDTLFLVTNSISIIVLSFFGGLLLSIFVELPCAQLEKLLFSKRS